MTASIVRQAAGVPGLRLVLLLALVIRATVAMAAYARQTTSAPDSMTYVRPVAALVESGRFDSFGAPELARTPGYPLVLALGELAGNMLAVTLAVQVIVNCLTVFGVAALALAMGAGTRVAMVAAAMYAVEPSSIIYVTKVLTETLFTAFVTGLLVAFTCWLRGGSKVDLVIGGVCLAAGCFVRPILYYAPVLLALLGMMAWQRQGSRRRALADVALFFVVAVMPIAAWRARNAMVAGYDGFAAITDVNLMEYRAAGAIARRSGEPIAQVQLRIRREWNADQSLTATGRFARGHERAGKYHGMRARAEEIIRNDPMAVAADAVAGAARTIFGRDTSEWSSLLGLTPRSVGWQAMRVVLTALWLSMLGLAVAGLVRGRWDIHGLLPALVLSVYLVAVAAGPEAYSRFRLAIVPPIAVLAACGAIQLSALRGRRAVVASRA
jgi:hypothetical protein